MPQLSRPFQIVVVVFVLFAGVWLFVLQGHSSNNNGSASSVTVTSTAAPATTAKAPASGSTAATGTSASGSSLGSLGHAIAKAHHAASVAKQNANQLESKSASQSNETPSTQASSSTATHTPASSSTHKASTNRSSAAKPVVKTSTGSGSTPNSSGSSSSKSGKLIPSGQRRVEADLTAGKVVVVLFWDPAGTDDALTNLALQPLRNAKKLAIQEAPASAVANYGSVTRGVTIYATPTILVINKRGHAIVLTGLQDTYAIEQAIAEARSS